MTYEPIISQPESNFLEDKTLEGNIIISECYTEYIFSTCAITEHSPWNKTACTGTAPTALHPHLPEVSDPVKVVIRWNNHAIQLIPAIIVPMARRDHNILHLTSSKWFLFTKEHCNLTISRWLEIFCTRPVTPSRVINRQPFCTPPELSLHQKIRAFKGQTAGGRILGQWF